MTILCWPKLAPPGDKTNLDDHARMRQVRTTAIATINALPVMMALDSRLAVPGATGGQLAAPPQELA